ncbi:hypothetical protein QL285_069943 [Trifolium repens]|nr:hypothetical protein QL285_069943 [Trifolium repens]
MAARPSNEIVQRPFNPVLPPVIDLLSQEKLVFKDNVTDAGPESFEFVTEKFVDFESFKVNGIDIQSLFYDQQWKNYFEMLNGFVYYDIVKYFWVSMFFLLKNILPKFWVWTMKVRMWMNMVRRANILNPLRRIYSCLEVPTMILVKLNS